MAIRDDLASIASFTEQQLNQMTDLKNGIVSLSNAFNQLNLVLSEQVKTEKELSSAQEETSEELERRKRLIEDLTLTEQDRTANQRLLADQEISLRELTGQLNKELKDGTDINSALIQSIKDRIIQTKNDIAATKELINVEDDLEKSREKRKNQLKELKRGSEAFGDSLYSQLGTIAQTTLGINIGGNAFSGLAEHIFTAQEQGFSLKETLGSMGKGFTGVAGKAKLFNVGMGIIIGVVNKFVEATVASIRTAEQLGDTLGRQMGLVSSFSDIDAIGSLARQSDNAFATFSEVGGAIAKLQEQTRGMFGNIVQTRPELGLFAAEMKELGIETDTTAELFGNFGAILGKNSVEDIQKVTKAAAVLSRQFGLSSDQIAADIAKIALNLGAFGAQADDLAIKIQKISLSLGVSADSVVSFGDAFAYLPDAIENAANLNFVFQKTAFDGVEMFRMMQSGAEGQAQATISLARNLQSLDESYFNNPTKRRALINSITQLGFAQKDTLKLLGQVDDARRRGVDIGAELEKDKEAQVEYNKALAKFGSLTQQLTKFQERFAIAMGPVLDNLTGIVKKLNEMDPETLRMLTSVAVGIGGALAGGALFGPVGAIVGGLGGLVGANMLMSSAGAFNDGILYQEPGKPAQIQKISTNPQDTIVTTAFKPGGPLAAMGAQPNRRELLPLKVDVFGKEVINTMVDLVTEGQGARKELDAVIYSST